MGITNFWKRKEEKLRPAHFLIDTNKKESYSGEVEQKLPMLWKKDVGEDHPFDPRVTEGIYCKFGLATGVVDKYVDYIWGAGIEVVCNEPGGEKAVKIINDFLRDIQFSSLGRAWVKEALIKPGGYLELGGGKGKSVAGVKVLDGKYMFVKRDKFGIIEGYSQYVGGFKRFEPNKVIPFDVWQIAALHFNKVGDSPYGLGILYPAVPKIDQLIGIDKDIHTIVRRKANNPLHIKIGSTDPNAPSIPSADEIARIRTEMETLTARTEWVTDPYWDIKSVDTGNVGEKFDTILKHDLDMLVFTFQVPEVLLGRGSIPEGLAKVQSDAFERRIASFQEEIEKVMEEQIFNRVLQGNGLDLHVEVNWGQPTSSEKAAKITQLQSILSIMDLNPAIRTGAEEQLAVLLGIDPKLLIEGEKEREQEEKEVEQPEVPGEKNTKANTSQGFLEPFTASHVEHHDPDRKALTEDITHSNPPKSVNDPFNPDATIHEWLGFNYKDFTKNIIGVIDADEFELIRAVNSVQLEAGYLTDTQIEIVKDIFRDGFKKGQSIRDIAKQLNDDVGLQDLYQMESDDALKFNKEGNPVLSSSAADRGIIIARTESTRLAMKGSADYYKEKGFTQYRWVAANSDRTCEECAGLNGKIFPLSEVPEPAHVYCRCSVTAVTELDDELTGQIQR